MEEQDKKELTVGDILDQLVKPPVTKSPSQTSQATRPTVLDAKPFLDKKPDGEIKLPQLGKNQNSESSSQSSPGKESKLPKQESQPTELRLSIRTMAGDIARIKSGNISNEDDFQKTIISQSSVEEKIPDIPEPPVLPEREPVSLPDIENPPLEEPSLKSRGIKIPFFNTNNSPPPFVPERPAHIHEEFQIADKDNLPPFPGGLIPKKKVARPDEEKVEYGAIARVVSSGMTTGIIVTVIIAVVVYFLLSFFVFNNEESISPIATQNPIIETPASQINELLTIFSGISGSTLVIPADAKQTIPALKSFVEKEPLEKKKFKRIDITTSGSSEGSTPTFQNLLTAFNVSYPSSLNNHIKENNLVLLYGQEEVFNGDNQADSEKRLVFIFEVNNVDKIPDVMKTWEETMESDLMNLFSIDPSKRVSMGFLDNERRGVQIRYKNFPLPDKSIDYSIVTSLTGRHYLIITNSRESMYSPADKIRGL